VGVQISVGASQSNAVLATVEILVPTTFSTAFTSNVVVTSANSVFTTASVYSTTVVSSITSASVSSATVSYATATNSLGVVAYTGKAVANEVPITGLIAIMLALVL